LRVVLSHISSRCGAPDFVVLEGTPATVLGAMLTPIPCFLEDIHEGKQRFSLSYGVWHDDTDGE
jgi:hypothetical protein